MFDPELGDFKHAVHRRQNFRRAAAHFIAQHDGPFFVPIWDQSSRAIAPLACSKAMT